MFHLDKAKGCLESFMLDTRESVIERLLESYRAYYNVNLFEEEQRPLTARCDFFEHSEKFVLTKKAELWSADSEEFLYILDIPHLTAELFEKWRDYVYEDGMGRLHIGPGHMYSFITPVFICDSCEESVIKAVRKCRIYKSFHFSFHGWMDYHVALVDLGKGRVYSNASGHSTAKILKKLLKLK